MILPGTVYQIIKPINGIEATIKTLRISEWADPCSNELEVEYEHKKARVLKQIIENQCELVTDFSQCIYFYSAFEKYGEFSNFSEHGITIQNEYYPTVEHYYQAQKFVDPVYQKRIRTCKSPKKASELGKDKTQPLIEHWDKKKLEVMFTALMEKFSKQAQLKALLLSTDSILLIENSPYDNFWGIGRTGIGLNYLGTMLMRVRSELSSK